MCCHDFRVSGKAGLLKRQITNVSVVAQEIPVSVTLPGHTVPPSSA